MSLTDTDLERTRAAQDADDLAERVDFLEDCVGRAPLDRSEGYAIHMLDPSASSDAEFDSGSGRVELILAAEWDEPEAAGA